MKICVLERGWVMVGHLEKDGDEYLLINGHVIRRWGTTEGLGELAMKGPLPETCIEKTPLVKFNKSQLIFTISCDESKWK
ncbi:MAG TPA: hypothetical protein VK590_08780 [Saprospiraceae bacterium]|nr:hypothetical protein [Saprospiraceae bacterium]